MNPKEFEYWRSVIASSKGHWVEYPITRLNRGEGLYYTGGEKGRYMRITANGKLTIGTYENAFPHIGEAIFTVDAEHQYENENEAIEAACKIGGSSFVEDLFAGNIPNKTQQQEVFERNESGGGRMQFKAVLSNRSHPEYGQRTVAFPIPKEEYDQVMGLLKDMEMGDALVRDCCLDELDSYYAILKRLEETVVNIDELDYLAKRLDSFDVGEAAQFQAMSVKLGISDMTDFINLTFCCQQATVVTDFSDLNRIGRDHLLNLNGGSMSTAELDSADGRMVALKLILSEEGTVTPYGVVYDNGMKLDPRYNGRDFPAYLYEPCVMTIEMRPRFSDANEPGTYLCLPMTQTQIERAMLRAGIDTYADMQLRFDGSELPDELDVVLDFESESLGSLNRMCMAISTLDCAEMPKLAAAVQFVKPSSAAEITELAKNLDLFDFAPKVYGPEEYGKYMIMESGHFDYDENLASYIDFAQYGLDRMEREQGAFTDRGYVSYHGTLELEELLQGDPAEQFQKEQDFQMGGME